MPEHTGTSRNKSTETKTASPEEAREEASHGANVPPCSAVFRAVHTVIGPPGTGKTRYVARQVELAVKAGENPIVVSLTKAAAEEAAGRGLLLPRGHVSTLHSLAYRALGAKKIAESPKHVKEWNESHPQFVLSASRAADEDNAAVDAAGEDMLRTLQIARARMKPIATQPGRVQRFASRWEAWKQKEGLLDFTDLIEQCLKYVDAAPGDPTVIFADEAQDMSQLEMALVEKWGEKAGRLVRVGDPWQNLYEWRGTDAGVMGTPDRVLAQSYRVSPRRL